MPRVTKEKIPHEQRMHFGGWCADPEADADVFNRLPGWRQAEILETRRIFREQPGVQAWEIINPATMKPYPGQVLVRDLLKKTETKRLALPEVPAAFKFTVPNGVPLSLLKWNYSEAYTAPEVEAMLAALRDNITHETVLLYCTHEGKLLNRKPSNGIFAYIWRHARFAAGLDACIPTTCYWDLDDGLTQIAGKRVTSDLNTVQPILSYLEQKAVELVKAVGGNPHEGASRWGKAVGLL